MVASEEEIAEVVEVVVLSGVSRATAVIDNGATVVEVDEVVSFELEAEVVIAAVEAMLIETLVLPDSAEETLEDVVVEDEMLE